MQPPKYHNYNQTHPEPSNPKNPKKTKPLISLISPKILYNSNVVIIV